MISCTANDKRYTAYIFTPADHGFTAELIVYIFCASQSPALSSCLNALLCGAATVLRFLLSLLHSWFPSIGEASAQ